MHRNQKIQIASAKEKKQENISSFIMTILKHYKTDEADSYISTDRKT